MNKFSVVICTVFFSITIMAASASAISVGLLNADAGNVASVTSTLVNTGKFTNADITDLGQNTSYLSSYDAILCWSNLPWTNNTAIGNALASYVDNGGGLVLSTYNFSSGWQISGNILNTGYSPYQPVAPNTGGPFSGMLNMSSATHEIFNGLSSVSYWTNNNYSDPILTGTELAQDTYGNSVVAINSAGNIIGINIFAGYMNTGTSGDLFANSLNYVASPSAVPEPGTMLLLGSTLFGIGLFKRKK